MQDIIIELNAPTGGENISRLGAVAHRLFYTQVKGYTKAEFQGYRR